MKRRRYFQILMLILTLFVSITVANAAAKKKPVKKGKAAVPQLNIQAVPINEDTFEVSSYLIETSTGAILIDTQMTISQAESIVELLKKRGKSLAAIFITHPHPDHYNNIGTFLTANPNLPVYATQATITAMQEGDAALRKYWSQFYGKDYSVKLVLPNRVVAAGDSLVIDNLALTIDEVNGGESRNEMIVYFPASKALFVGDLVFNRVHANIKEGHSKEWLSNLQAVIVKYPDVATIYPGHGQPGARTLLTDQVNYLTTFRQLISSRFDLKHPSEPFNARAYQQVMKTMVATFPYTSELLLSLSAESLIEELLQEAGYTPAEEDEE